MGWQGGLAGLVRGAGAISKGILAGEEAALKEEQTRHTMSVQDQQLAMQKAWQEAAMSINSAQEKRAQGLYDVQLPAAKEKALTDVEQSRATRELIPSTAQAQLAQNTYNAGHYGGMATPEYLGAEQAASLSKLQNEPIINELNIRGKQLQNAGESLRNSLDAIKVRSAKALEVSLTQGEKVKIQQQTANDYLDTLAQGTAIAIINQDPSILEGIIPNIVPGSLLVNAEKHTVVWKERDPQTGQESANGMPQEYTDAIFMKVKDYLPGTGISGRRGTSSQGDTAEIKNVKFLTANGVPLKEAQEMVFSKRSQSKRDFIGTWAAKFMKDDGQEASEAVKNAETIWNEMEKNEQAESSPDSNAQATKKGPLSSDSWKKYNIDERVTE